MCYPFKVLRTSYLDIDSNKIKPIVEEFNVLLADYNINYQNLRGFYWNVMGRNFFNLHNKFEELYTDARIKIDEIAERILTLRHNPKSKFSNHFELANVGEAASLIPNEEMVALVLRDHEYILNQMGKVVEMAQEACDEGTIDLRGGYIGNLEKVSRMLDAWGKESRDK